MCIKTNEHGQQKIVKVVYEILLKQTTEENQTEIFSSSVDNSRMSSSLQSYWFGNMYSFTHGDLGPRFECGISLFRKILISTK